MILPLTEAVNVDAEQVWVEEGTTSLLDNCDTTKGLVPNSCIYGSRGQALLYK